MPLPPPDATPALPEPAPGNGFCAAYAQLLCSSFQRWTGRLLAEAPPEAPDVAPDIGQRLFEARFALLAHGGGADPVFRYGNRTALTLFGLTWAQLTRLPSRLSAEPEVQAERARLLRRVTERGYIDDYAGVRIARSGRRFRIRGAIVWTLLDDQGSACGQAARFAEWEWLD